MFEGDDISCLRIPSLCKFWWSCWCIESHPIRSNCKKQTMSSLLRCFNVWFWLRHLQFAFPLLRGGASNYSCFSVSIFLLFVSFKVKTGGKEIIIKRYEDIPYVWDTKRRGQVEGVLEDLSEWLLLLLYRSHLGRRIPNVQYLYIPPFLQCRHIYMGAPSCVPLRER